MANQESAHAATIQSITVEPAPNERNALWFFYHLDNGTTVKELTSYRWTPDGRWEYSGSGDPEVGVLQPDGTLAEAPTPEPTPVPDVTPILQRMADAINRGEYNEVSDLISQPDIAFGEFRTLFEEAHGPLQGDVTVAPFTEEDHRRYGPVGALLVWDFERATVRQPILVDIGGGGTSVTVHPQPQIELKNQ
jgi:hypothetical protein